MGKAIDRNAELAGQAASMLPGGALLEGFVHRAVRESLLELERLNSPALRAAEFACGRRREAIAQSLEANPHLIPLVSRVLFHVGSTNQDEILHALGAMLGALILTPDDTEEVEMIVLGIGDLRRIHLQVLRLMASESPKMRLARKDTGDLVDKFEAALSDAALNGPDADDRVTVGSDTWNVEGLAFEIGIPERQVELAIAGLLKSGFVVSPPVLDGPGYRITSSGETVMEVLRRYQTHAPVERDS